MRLLYGTRNQAKVDAMREALLNGRIEIVGPRELGMGPLEVDETGNDPLANARIKAWSYFRAARMPAFSCDSGLYIDGLEESLQPGVHVREVNGRYLDDEQMIEHYSRLARRCGGQCVAQYRNAICLVLDEHAVHEHMGDDISGERFLISCRAHERRREGFPLDSLSVHIGSGRYYLDMGESRVSTTYEGFRAFFERFVPLGPNS